MHKESTLLLDELQATWDEQSLRIDQIIATSDAKAVPSRKSRPSLPLRLRLLYGYAVISVVILACSVYWALLIPSLAYNIPTLVISLMVEGILVLILYRSIYFIIELIKYNPARVCILRRSSPEPSDGIKERAVKSYNEKLDITYRVSVRLIRHAAAACITAVIALTTVSCTTTGTDGYTITQNHHARIAAVESVSNILSII